MRRDVTCPPTWHLAPEGGDVMPAIDGLSAANPFTGSPSVKAHVCPESVVLDDVGIVDRQPLRLLASGCLLRRGVLDLGCRDAAIHVSQAFGHDGEKIVVHRVRHSCSS